MMREAAKTLSYVVRITFASSPIRAIAALVLEVTASVAQPLFGLWLKMIVEGSVRGHEQVVMTGSISLAASATLYWLAGGLGARLRMSINERISFVLDERLAIASSSLPGLEHQERPDYLDKMELIRENAGGLGELPNAIINLVSAFAAAAATLVLLTRLHPLLVLLPVFALPTFWLQSRSEAALRKAEEDAAPFSRRIRHLYEIATTATAGKELRVFGTQELIRARHKVAWLEMHHRRLSVHWRVALVRSASWIVFALGFTAAVIFVTLRAVRGENTVGDVILVITLAQRVNSMLGGTLDEYAWTRQQLRTGARLVWIVQYAKQTPTVGLHAPPAVMVEGIAIEDVSFRYPGTAKDVLQNISLVLPAGSVIALVGPNGSGKTTLAKLLGKFYEPSGGTIRIDSLDLREVDTTLWREGLRGAFQDFARFELKLREAVGVGDLPRLNNSEVIRRAMHEAAGSDVEGALAEGLETQLGISWTGGVDVSVGQWQKIAVARGFMRTQPLLTILDEPTASLDAETEHALFERFTSAAQASNPSRGITILVSHRFSTVRMADWIVVLESGRVVQSGPHDVLMDEDGLYRQLFEAQARSYG